MQVLQLGIIITGNLDKFVPTNRFSQNVVNLTVKYWTGFTFKGSELDVTEEQMFTLQSITISTVTNFQYIERGVIFVDILQEKKKGASYKQQNTAFVFQNARLIVVSEIKMAVVHQ